MSLYNLMIQNKDMLKILYTLIVAFICVVIVVRADRIFRLSLHTGIRYFRNAFLFYGIAFVIRTFLGAFSFYGYLIPNQFNLIKAIFEFFMVMAGFFLLYSLLWKKLEVSGKDYFSSLFNFKIAIFYVMTLLIVFLDFLWSTFFFMFVSQIILFLFASILSYINFKREGNEHKFLKIYFIAMILSLIAWILNAVAALYFNWNMGIIVNIYLINVIILLLFLYGVIKVTKNKS